MRFTICPFMLILIGLTLLSSTQVGAGVTPLTAGECANMQADGVITSVNPVSCKRLCRVNFQYINFEGATAVGNIVVLDAVADQTEAIFTALFERRFPIHQSVAMENYQGNDEAAMMDNNTSAFNGRRMTEGSSWSKHAYGVAIDINPLQNPYISFSDDGHAKVLPAASAQAYVNRNDLRSNKDTRTGMVESVVEIFARHGFITWGGEWDSPIDYQHFEIGSGEFIQGLIKQTPDAARETFKRYAQSYRDCAAYSTETHSVKKRVACVEQVRK